MFLSTSRTAPRFRTFPLDMPDGGNNYRRHARQPKRPRYNGRPIRNDNGRNINLIRRERSPRGELTPRREYPRPEMISRNAIRLLRRPPRRGEHRFAIDPQAGGAIFLSDISARSTFRTCGVDAGELGTIAAPNDPTREMRFGVFSPRRSGERARV